MIKTMAVFGACTVFPHQWAAQVSGRVSVPSTGDLGIIRINLADFPPLQTAYGSVRMGTSRVAGLYPAGIFFPVLVTRGPEGEFHAFSAECTHASCTLPSLDPNTKLYQCPCHGSAFRFDGTVASPPATFPLRKFKSSSDGKQLIIEVPDIGFSVETGTVQTGQTKRLKLDFLSFEAMEYEVAFRPALAAPWQPALFSLAPDGPLDQTSFAGVNDYVSLYVSVPPAGAGFYAVFLRVKKV